MSRVVQTEGEKKQIIENKEEEEEEEEEEDEDDEDEEDEEEDDEEEEEDEDDDEEPKLKYERLGNSVLEILKTDSASCLFVFERFLALGTRAGKCYVLDFNGNEIRQFNAHKTVINELSVDDDGEFIASCSDDGTVVVNGLYSPEPSTHSYSRVVKFLAIDPKYSHKNNKSFACGGPSGQLTVTTKGWFAGKNQVIYQNEGPIHAIQWRENLLAFATDQKTIIFDSRSWTPIGSLAAPAVVTQSLGTIKPATGTTTTTTTASSSSSPSFKCCLCWENNQSLLIGWGDSVTVLRFTERDVTAGRSHWHLETIHSFTTSYWICGLSPFGSDLVILAFYDIEEGGKAAYPELKVVLRSNGQEIASDSLKINFYERYSATDYRLDSFHADSLYYIVSPKDIVVARQRNADDHITWLLQKAKQPTNNSTNSSQNNPNKKAKKTSSEWYEDACRAALKNENVLRKHSVEEVGELFLHHLLATKQHSKAAEWCPKILRGSAPMWENWIMRFSFMKQLPALSKYLPLQNPRLGQGQYEMVLGSFLTANDYEGFKNLIQIWPSHLYDIDVIATAVQKQMEEHGDSIPLKQSLVTLYTEGKQYKKALDLYLSLKHSDVFEFIEKHDLFDAIKDRVTQIINFKTDTAIEMLVTHTNRIPIADVVKQLDDNPFYLHLYLHELFQKDHRIAAEYHERQVELYANYHRELLLPFLKISDSYPLEKARKICEEKKLDTELVYILDRMGSSQEALYLLIEKLNDVEGAIKFALEKNDESLWNSLITYSLSSSEMVGELLEHMGVLEDPLQLIQRIPIMKITSMTGSAINSGAKQNNESIIEVSTSLININQIPSLIIFLEYLSPEKKQSIFSVYKQFCENYFKKKGKEILFFYSEKQNECSEDLRRQLFIPNSNNLPELVYLDVPQNGKFYTWQNYSKTSNITEETIRSFLKAIEEIPNTNVDSIKSETKSTKSETKLIYKEQVLGLEIPDLKHKLVKITKDASNEISLLKGCWSILESDSLQLSNKFIKQSKKCVRFDSDLQCAMCGLHIVFLKQTTNPDPTNPQPTKSRNLVMFFCGHAYHLSCLPTQTPAGLQQASDLLFDESIRYYCPTCQSAANQEHPRSSQGGARPSYR